ncbi:MATE family efflux transporter [Solitalea koreensis]|uniref:Multidrug-efflux transporter n=1 Tax=Solitalea koreensis TaxID=543615 RepID=A0A521BE27_9SPHI|nr:MATE family efflux transporter [Solitalea koreensis]SMO45313.1 multidrug resistance protein, MATE family [Solitalea koreensis]
MKKIYSKYKQHYNSNFYLAYPVVISQLGHTLVALSDSIIIGQTGTIPLAGVSLGNSIFTLFLVTGIGISYGLTPLIAQENGRKNYPECGRLLSHSLLINLITGFLLFLLIFGGLFALEHLGQPVEVVKQAKPFLGLLGLSAIPLMIFLTFKQFAEGLGFTKQAMKISIWGNIINIFLGIILVFGLLGIKPMGIVGVGIATLVDRLIMAITMSFYVFRSKRFRKYLTGFRVKNLNFERGGSILGIGVPVAMQYIFEVGAFSGAAIMIGWMGAKQLAAHQIALSLAALTYMMASGISSAAAIRAGNNFGQKNFNELRLSSIASYHMVIVFMSVCALLFMIANKFLPTLYVRDPQVIYIASGLLIIAGFFQLFDGLQVVGLGILRGMGDVKIPTAITLIAYWVIGLPLGYILGFTFGYGVYGVWWSLLLGLLVAAFLLFLRFNYLTRKMQN